MALFGTVLVSSGLVFAFSSGAAEAQHNVRAAGKMVTLQMPAIPEPARLTLDPKTTALIVLDCVEPICNAQLSCKDKMLPAMTPSMERAHEVGPTVAYGTRAQNMSKWLIDVAPIKVVNTAQDRFYNADLDKALKEKVIKTPIMVGWKLSGSVIYTSVGTIAHDYTVVVPVDTSSAGSGYETTIDFNVLNSGNSNLAKRGFEAQRHHTKPDRHDHLPIRDCQPAVEFLVGPRAVAVVTGSFTMLRKSRPKA
jgi:hypothetical protein